MKQNVMLTIASLLSILLLTLHITDDIVRGISKAEPRSEEHTSELQSQSNIVCRLLLEKKNINDSARLPADHVLRRSVLHRALSVAAAVAVGIVLGLALAIVVAGVPRGPGIVRTVMRTL